jgi:parvulin-like peptidyl-prolyl isomerase
MNKVVAFLGIIALLVGSTGAAEIIDGVVAYVNNRVVTVGEVRRAISAQRRELMRSYEGKDLVTRVNAAYAEAVDLLVDRALILTEFDRLLEQKKLQIPMEAIEGRVDELIERSVGMDRTSLMDALVKDGMSLEALRRPYRERVIIAILRNMEVDSKVRVSPGRVREVYEERLQGYARPARIRLSMMEWKGAGQEVRATAQDVRARLLDGARFETLAREYSQGAYRDKGGDRGWLEINDLRREIKDAVAGLEDGEVSELIEVGARFYLARVVAREAADVRPLAAVHDEIVDDLQDKASRELYTAWIERLKQKSYLRIVSDVITEEDMPMPRPATSD